jgi:hypothetical protein
MALVIWYNKELQAHPMKLIFVIAFVETSLAMITYTSYNVCTYHLYEFFAETVYFRSDLYAQQRALWVLAVSANFFSIFFIFMNIVLNAALAIDLILMLKYPFKAKEPRIPMYVITAFITSCLLCITWVMTVAKSQQLNTIRPAKPVMWFAVTLIVLQLLISIVSIIYALVKLCRPGISKESRKLVLIRHILSIIFFNISNLYIIIILLTWIFSEYIKKNNWNVVDNKWIGVSKIIFASQGIYLPILRLVEPFFFKTLKENIIDLVTFVFCCRKKINKDDMLDEDAMFNRNLFDEKDIAQFEMEFKEMK